MSDFEKELREAKERAKREADARSQEFLDADRERVQKAEAEQKARRERRRYAIEQYVIPNKPMVDRLMEALGKQQWGSSNYGLDFQKYEEPTSATFEGNLATWQVGRDRYTNSTNDKWIPIKGVIPGWKEKLPIRGGGWFSGGYIFSHRECFQLFLVLDNGSTYFSGKQHLGRHEVTKTTTLDERQLQELLLKEFRMGPLSVFAKIPESPSVQVYDVHGPGG